MWMCTNSKKRKKALEDPNFYLTDGKVTLMLAPWKIQDYYGTEHKGPGLDHLGFRVESVDAFKNDVEILTKADPEWLAPKSPISKPSTMLCSDCCSNAATAGIIFRIQRATSSTSRRDRVVIYRSPQDSAPMLNVSPKYPITSARWLARRVACGQRK